MWRFIFGEKPKRTIMRVVCIVLVSYVLFGVLLLFFQRSLIYFPQSKSLGECDIDYQKMEHISFGDEQALYAPGNTARLVVLYHGNADSVCDWKEMVYTFGYHGDGVLIPEWPGYGGDSRTTTKQALFTMVEQWSLWIQDQNYDEVYVVSYSIGSAPAAYHVSLGEIDRLLMFAPFDELIRVVWDRHIYYPRVVLHDDFDNLSFLRNAGVPVWIMHGEADSVVLYERSLRLANNIQEEVQEYVLVPGKNHLNLLSGNEYNRIIDQFLNQKIDE